jgi:hypothetical protein
MNHRRNSTKYVILGVLFGALALPASAQSKFALVIGNGAYTLVPALKNPVNDANDMEAVLKSLGFQVDLIKDGTLQKMNDGVDRFRKRLAGDPQSYGFFFYAGHGVQSNGSNYLIPVNANITSESNLRYEALEMQQVLDNIQEAENTLNIVVLDACRDNPFGWSRGSSRGLSVVSRQPPGSIVVYATSAGSTAADGTGQNGLFTSHLLNNLKNPKMEVYDVFRQTMADVQQASNGRQVPAISSQLAELAYLGTRPGVTPSPIPAPKPEPPQVLPSPEEWKNKWIYSGIRVGASPHWYRLNTSSDIESDTHAAFEAALTGEVQITNRFAFQTELAFSNDTVSATDDDTIDVTLHTFTLIIPALAKLTFRPGKFYFAGFAGPYFTIPLGSMDVKQNGQAGTYGYTAPAGFTGGADAGMKVGPGVLVLDFRYSADFKYFLANDAAQYSRNMFSVSFGYNYGFINKTVSWSKN